MIINLKKRPGGGPGNFRHEVYGTERGRRVGS